MSGRETLGAGSLLNGRYRLSRRLGSGGMAVVWEARDERLGREVAVKILSDVLAEDEDYRRRFEREARVAAGFTHPALVGLHDFGTESGRPYLVMELVRGDTLAERIAAGSAGRLDLAKLARELLEALAYMHAEGVVHRDLKPGNVLIGPERRARLTDFGIAQPEDATALTRTGQVIGTRSYLSPEVQRGKRATPRSDLYALGVVLRECGGERDPALRTLIARLCAEEPADRPGSAEEARAILDETAATMPAAATEPTAPLGATKPTVWKRRPGWVLPGLAALAAVAAAVVLASGDDGGGPVSTPEQSPQGKEAPGASGAQPAQPAPPDPASEPESNVPAPISCAEIEAQKRAIEDEKKAAEENAGNDKQAKEAIKEQFEAKKRALQERAKECKEK